MNFTLDENINTNYTVFHRYWICQSTITPYKKKNFGNLKLITQNGNSSSTVHKCRLVPQDPNNDFNKFYAMKVISFIKSPVPQKSKQSRYINPFAKNLQQIETEYTVLQLLNKCHRVAKFQQLIVQNSKREDDKQFFYRFLKKGKSPGQRYICLITEFCNQGDLDSIVESRFKKLTEEIVIGYAAQIIEGLLQLKKKRVIHRDLRLCNILVHNGEIKFSDFDTSFIGGKSTWQDVKNGIDIQTSPPQIIELASKPDEQLKRYDSQDLYQRQQKSDIYFFGLALFKMIFGYNYQKFNTETLSNMIEQKLETSTYSKDVLQLLVNCLEQKAEKRIDFISLYQKFKQIQKLKYYDQRILNKIYLSDEPICFAAFKSLDSQSQNLAKLDDDMLLNQSNPFNEVDFSEQMKRSQQHRLTFLYKNTFCTKSKSQLDALWTKIQNERHQQKIFKENMQIFIRTISTHSYYYQCLYKAILGINLRNLKIKQDILYVHESKSKLEQELTIVLSFLFKMLFKTPFTRDKRYSSNDLPYETMKLFRSIIKSDVIQNKMHCYFGKSRQFDYKSSQTTKKITQFLNKKYNVEDSFQPVYQNLINLVEEIDYNLKQLLKLTIVNLRLAYNNILKKENSNIKEILFILIVLQQIDIQSVKKNEMIVIWDRLLPLMNEEVQLDKDQADLIFNQHSKTCKEDQFKVTGQKLTHTVAMFALEEKLGQNGNENEDQVDNPQIYQKSPLEVLDLNIKEMDQDELQNFQAKGDIQLFENQQFSLSSIKSKKNSPIQFERTKGKNEEEDSEIIAQY